MSFDAMAWAVKQKCETAGQKLVLLMLSSHTNGHTGQCNPSHSRLAEECSMGKSTLKTHLTALAEKGLIKIVQRTTEGVNLSNQYVVNFDEVGQNLADGGTEFDLGVGQILATKQEVINLELKHFCKTKESPPLQVNSESGDSTFQLTAPKSPHATQVPHESIVALWAKHLPSARQPIKWHASRQSALRSRWREDDARQSLTWWDGFFQYIARIDFLMGRTSAQDRTPFVITIDWVLELKNFTKILEGVYER